MKPLISEKLLTKREICIAEAVRNFGYPMCVYDSAFVDYPYRMIYNLKENNTKEIATRCQIRNLKLN